MEISNNITDAVNKLKYLIKNSVNNETGIKLSMPVNKETVSIE
jgi:hypothetical protein